MARSRVKSDDVYILDLGLQLYQWNGNKSNKDERFKAMQYLENLKSERSGEKVEVLDEDSTPPTHVFYTSLTEPDTPDHEQDRPYAPAEKHLYKVSDAAGHVKCTEVKKGKISKSDFDSHDVFILDVGNECFVWVGHGASPEEKKNGLGYAHGHLMKTDHPLVPIVVIKEGQHNKAFSAAVAA
jgi:gelsolin